MVYIHEIIAQRFPNNMFIPNIVCSNFFLSFANNVFAFLFLDEALFFITGIDIFQYLYIFRWHVKIKTKIK